MYEEGDTLVVEVELPGRRPDDIEVSVDPQLLEIRAGAPEVAADRIYRRRERGFGPTCREIPLPVLVRREGVEATLCDGVLRVRMPVEDARPESMRCRVTVGCGIGLRSGASASGEND